MILYCKNCGYVWKYRGQKYGKGPGTSCPRCKKYVPFDQRVDEPLPDLGDYSGAKYIGVLDGGGLVYFDPVERLLVTFYGTPDPYSESREKPIAPGELFNEVMRMALDVGWKYRIRSDQIKNLDKEGQA